MLIEFAVENYRSIAEKQTLSFVAGKHKSDAEGEPAVECDGFPGHQLLTSAVIYGANASGKSNVLRAMGNFWERVVLSASMSEANTDIQPFRLDPIWVNKPSRFEATFLMEGVRYQYGFALDAKRIHEEWLIAYPRRTAQLWFHRQWDGSDEKIQFGTHLKGEKNRLHKMTRPDALFLSIAAQFNHEQLGLVHRWIHHHMDIRQAKFIDARTTAELIESNKDLQGGIAKILRAADIGIDRISVERHSKIEEPGSSNKVGRERKTFIGTNKPGEYLEITIEHQRTDGTKVLFDLWDESQGTVRYFALLAPLLSTIGKGGILVIDELDDSLHPLLVRKLVSLLHRPKVNEKKAQLLFNTHDTTLLDPSLFRRDQIWFTEKAPPGKTKLYSLLEFSPRKKEALQKGYLEGRYGAIPFLGNFDFSEALSSLREKDA